MVDRLQPPQPEWECLRVGPGVGFVMRRTPMLQPSHWVGPNGRLYPLDPTGQGPLGAFWAEEGAAWEPAAVARLEEEEDYSGIHRRALREELPPGARPAPTNQAKKEATPLPSLPLSSSESGIAVTPQRPVAAPAPLKPQEQLTRKDSQEIVLVRVVMAIGKNTNKNFGSNWDSISTSVVAELRAQQLFDENRNFNAEQCRTLYKKLQDSWKLFNNALGPNRTGNMKNMSQEAVTKRPVVSESSSEDEAMADAREVSHARMLGREPALGERVLKNSSKKARASMDKKDGLEEALGMSVVALQTAGRLSSATRRLTSVRQSILKYRGWLMQASGEDKVELQADFTKLRDEEKELQAMIRELESPEEARVLPPAPARLSATKTHPKPASGAAAAASGGAAAGRGGAAAAIGGAAPAALGGAPAAMGAAAAAIGVAAPAALGGAPAAMGGAAPAAMGGAAPAALGGAPAAMGAAPAAWGGAAPAAWGVAPSGMGVAPAAWGAAPSSSGAAASSSGAAPAAQGLHQMYLQQLAILYQAVQRQQKQQEQVAAVEGEALQSQAFGPDTPKEATQRDAFFVPGTQYP
ncbi:hypothetical protein QJQ45_007260 [Haematococcus lacustris]|nr:hypothetical protein QJQ45_013572 [Haematococcus lacustris]KAJ9523571.1 hypothetical protein QJQ45_007260 [Haematococcus lacustris]